MDRRRMNGRRGGETGRPALDLRTGEERMIGMAFEEAPPEGVEVHEHDPRVLAELFLD
jgi:hypothetical protein